MTETTSEQAIARFMRTFATAALDLARELESNIGKQANGGLDIEQAGLGSLQLSVARQLRDIDSDEGLTPREVAVALDRGDEPNVRSALNRLAERSVAELVPGLPTQRWRLTVAYRGKGPS